MKNFLLKIFAVTYLKRLKMGVFSTLRSYFFYLKFENLTFKFLDVNKKSIITQISLLSNCLPTTMVLYQKLKKLVSTLDKIMGLYYMRLFKNNCKYKINKII